MKEFPERKPKDGPLDDGEGREGVTGGDGLEAMVQFLAGINHAAERLAPEGDGSLARYFAILARHFAQPPFVGALGVVAGGFRFVERFEDEAARPPQDVVAHAITMPPSTWTHWPVM